MVEGVEEIRLELRTSPFAKSRSLAETHVPVVDARLVQVGSCGPWFHTCRRPVRVKQFMLSAEELGQIARVGIVVKVASLSLGWRACHRSRLCPGYRLLRPVGKSLLEGCDAGQLPAANRPSARPVHAAAKLLAAAKGQLVDIAGHKPERHVEVRTDRSPDSVWSCP